MGIYFVRHGETDWNAVGRLQGKSDIPLNEKGETQARATSELLKAVHIDKIYCSPLLRAKKTADIVNEERNLEIYQDERLMERCFGEGEGIYRKELAFTDLWMMSDQPMFADGEDLVSFFHRVESFLDDILEEAQNSTILIVAHGGVGIPFQCYFDGYDCVEHYSDLIIANCEVCYREGEKFKQRAVELS